MQTYHRKIFKEITKLITDNLEILYNYNEEALVNLKKYCNKNNKRKYNPLTYNELIYYTEEAISELINTPYLYDLRSLDN